MQTIEEAANKLFKIFNKEDFQKDLAGSIDCVNSISKRENNAFKKGVKFAQRWIPVGEELPEIRDKSYQILAQKPSTPSGEILYRVIPVFSFEDIYALKFRLSKYTCWRHIELK